MNTEISAIDRAYYHLLMKSSVKTTGVSTAIMPSSSLTLTDLTAAQHRPWKSVVQKNFLQNGNVLYLCHPIQLPLLTIDH
jgi:hypothetical protein